ncbi:MAG: triose-phosphate isomerase [Spirochaetales bacterium]|jgi:triosephosphate isomerase|nr:triose-phosphate isomerase [Spirochaetales bacterium]
MRIKYIAGNWKMHKTVPEAVSLAQALVKDLASCGHKIMIAPPFTALEAVAKTVASSNILLGAQNMSNAEQGAHTGEVSVLMLKQIGVKVVILGHSERRAIYGEKDEFINSKVKLALAQGLEVILCVGETLQEREAGKANDIVSGQTGKGLAGIPEKDLGRVTIAYEPVWAIGTGKNATPQDADAIHAVIRAELKKLYSAAAAEAMIIQYGGSVKPENAKDLLTMPNIDGALVGGAALKPETFIPIVCFDK